MREIIVHGGYVCLVDDDDFESLNKYRWHLSTSGYATGSFILNGKSVNKKMHRLIMNPNEGYFIDHINGNQLDNRKCNLRICSHQENMMNRRIHKNNTSGYKGVTFHRESKKWRAQITLDSKRIQIGYFDDPNEAHKAYCEKAKELHGEFARFE